MASSIYQILTIISLIASAIYSILSILKLGISPRLKKKSDLINSLKIMSTEIREFYEEFNPPMRINNTKDKWFHYYFLVMLALSFTIIFTSHKFSFSMLYIIPAFIVESSVLITSYEIYEVGKMNSFLEAFSDKSSKKIYSELIKEAYRRNWFFIRFTVGKIIAVLFINVFIVSNVNLAQGSTGEIFFYTFLFVATFYLVILEAYLYRKMYVELEFVASQKCLATCNKKVNTELHIDITRNKNISLVGKLIAIGKFLYILREDGFIQEVNFKTIRAVSINETEIANE